MVVAATKMTVSIKSRLRGGSGSRLSSITRGGGAGRGTQGAGRCLTRTNEVRFDLSRGRR